MYEPFIKANRFLTTKRIGSISTTDLINRVLYNYDYYINQNIKNRIKYKSMGISKEKYFLNKINLVYKNNQKRKEQNKTKYYFLIGKGRTKKYKMYKKMQNIC